MGPRVVLRDLFGNDYEFERDEMRVDPWVSAPLEWTESEGGFFELDFDLLDIFD